MRIRVEDPSDVDGLITFLREEDYVAEEVGEGLVEVSRLSSVRHGRVRIELDVFLKAWQAANPDSRAVLLD